MSYVQKHLAPDEHVLFAARMHPALFIPAAFSLLVSAAAAYVADTPGWAGTVRTGILEIFSLLMLVQMLYFFFQALFAFTLTEFAVTSRRVLACRGLFRRHCVDLHLSKVGTIAVKADVPAWLRSGAVTVTDRDGASESFWPILDPAHAKARLAELMGAAAHN